MEEEEEEECGWASPYLSQPGQAWRGPHDQDRRRSHEHVSSDRDRRGSHDQDSHMSHDQDSRRSHEHMSHDHDRDDQDSRKSLHDQGNRSHDLHGPGCHTSTSSATNLMLEDESIAHSCGVELAHSSIGIEPGQDAVRMESGHTVNRLGVGLAHTSEGSSGLLQLESTTDPGRGGTESEGSGVEPVVVLEPGEPSMGVTQLTGTRP